MSQASGVHDDRHEGAHDSTSICLTGAHLVRHCHAVTHGEGIPAQ